MRWLSAIYEQDATDVITFHRNRSINASHAASNLGLTMNQVTIKQVDIC